MKPHCQIIKLSVWDVKSIDMLCVVAAPRWFGTLGQTFVVTKHLIKLIEIIAEMFCKPLDDAHSTAT